MNQERTRIILTLATVLGLGSLVALLRHRRAARRREQIAAAIEAMRSAEAALADNEPDAYITLASLEEARTMDHTAVILRGYGGRCVYLTAPVKYVACDEAALKALLHRLDAVEGNTTNGATLRFELAPIGSGIAGTEGGGSVIDGVWLSPRLTAYGLLPAVTDIVNGRQTPDSLGIRPDRTAP